MEAAPRCAENAASDTFPSSWPLAGRADHLLVRRGAGARRQEAARVLAGTGFTSRSRSGASGEGIPGRAPAETRLRAALPGTGQAGRGHCPDEPQSGSSGISARRACHFGPLVLEVSLFNATKSAVAVSSGGPFCNQSALGAESRCVWLRSFCSEVEFDRLMGSKVTLVGLGGGSRTPCPASQAGGAESILTRIWNSADFKTGEGTAST